LLGLTLPSYCVRLCCCFGRKTRKNLIAGASKKLQLLTGCGFLAEFRVIIVTECGDRGAWHLPLHSSEGRNRMEYHRIPQRPARTLVAAYTFLASLGAGGPFTRHLLHGILCSGVPHPGQPVPVSSKTISERLHQWGLPLKAQRFFSPSRGSPGVRLPQHQDVDLEPRPPCRVRETEKLQQAGQLQRGNPAIGDAAGARDDL